MTLIKYSIFLIVSILFTVGCSKPDSFDRSPDVEFNILRELEDHWQRGPRHFSLDDSKSRECISAENDVHPSFYSCHPDYIKCFYKNRKIKRKGRVYQIKIEQNDQGKASDGVSFSLQDEDLGPLVQGKLRNTCDQIVLPKGNYAYWNKPKDNNPIYFELHDLSFAIDKFLVSNDDVLKFSNTNKVKLKYFDKIAKEKGYAHAVWLTKDERVQYCDSQKKQLLNSFAFDAMATYRSPMKTKDSPVYYFSYPWKGKAEKGLVRRFDHSFLETLSCQQFYTKDCQDGFKYHLKERPSAVGVYEILGGSIEYFRNPFEPQKNVFLSSRYLTRQSPYHQLGMRSSWDGEGFLFKNLSPSLNEEIGTSDQLLNIGFRCFNYVL